MSHPFDLDPSDLEVLDLDFEEQLTELTEEECAQASGGGSKEKRHFKKPDRKLIHPIMPPIHPIMPPEATTLAIGEEGGDTDPIYMH